jgi:hypothetical protein
LKPLAAADCTIARTLSGLTRLPRVTHNARTSADADAARGAAGALRSALAATATSRAARALGAIMMTGVRT